MYTTEQAFEKLRDLGITKNIKSVRRWLRNGEIKGMRPQTRQEGWRIPDEALQEFIAKKIPAVHDISNVTLEPLEELENLRSEVEQLRVENAKLVEQVANTTNETYDDEIIRLKEENFQQLRQLASVRNELSQVKQRREKGAYARLEKKYQLLGNALINRGKTLSNYHEYRKEINKEDYEVSYDMKGEVMFLKKVIENLRIKYITELEWTAAREMFNLKKFDSIHISESKFEEILESFNDTNET